jgi:alkanesulfonate monooxygenase SsuD/methylene tetrahydromethanopterin reductase-like flavin-dependent oxidoreductase (luciferase family)
LAPRCAAPEQIGERIALYRDAVAAAGGRFDPRSVAVARDAYVATDAADLEQALARQARAHGEMIRLSRFADGRHRSHIMSYADRPEGTQAHGLYGTAEAVARKLEALAAQGVATVLLNGGRAPREMVRRFARDVMPGFA